jgi:hypothetical protein
VDIDLDSFLGGSGGDMKRLGKIVLMGFAAVVIAGLVVFILLTAVSLSTVGGCIYRAGISSAIVLDVSGVLCLT